MSGLGPYYGSGAQPISMNTSNRPRRESVAGSLVNGMSWGGVSVSSWIRDEYVNICFPINRSLSFEKVRKRACMR